MKKTRVSILLLVASCLVILNNSVCKAKKEMVEGEKKQIYLAGGCFWGTEHFLQQIGGVVNTEVGYANGKTVNPTYNDVCTGETGFTEAVKVEYNAEQIDLNKLLNLFFKTIDPTSVNQQGYDIGTQYRTGVYYTDKSDEAIIKEAINKLAKNYSEPIAVECKVLENYYSAEDYHQKYLDKNPGGYCHIPQRLFQMAKEANPIASLHEYEKKDDATLQKTLSPLQYEVTRKNATEAPFQNEYWNEFREGIYVDITTGEPLFISTDKFESGCGWPSFSKPINKSLIIEKVDKTHGMIRTEVRSKTGDAHLGHVFTNGPEEKGGLRYCINSASLRFIPKEEMAKGKYAKYLALFEK